MQADGTGASGEEGGKRHRSSSVRTGLTDSSGRLQSIVTGVEAIVGQLSDEQPGEATPTKDHLSLNELCTLIPYKPQTVRNLKAQGVLRFGEHYLQRRRHGRVVYVWSAMQRWLRSVNNNRPRSSPSSPPTMPVREKSGNLFFDFIWQRVRCKEYTGLPATAENLRRCRRTMRLMDAAMRRGDFEYQPFFLRGSRLQLFHP